MLRYVPALILTGALMADVSYAASQKLQVDLGAIDPGSELTLSVSPGDYTVEITSKVPNKIYNVQATVSFLTLPPLPLPRREATEEADPCPKLSASIEKIRNATNEAEVKAAVAEVRMEKESCADEPAKSQADLAIGKTQQQLPTDFSIASGQELVVLVTRADETGQKRWKVTYQTPARGRWFSSYGFAFVRNQDEQYFSKAKTGEDGKFLITRKANNRDYDFAPSLFFSWMPAQREGRDLNFGATAGLGFDQSNPIVFLGPMLTYNQNVSLMAGVVMHKQKRLNGIYSRDEEIMENLTEDQLKEETFKPNLFLGLSFRFGTNPFASSQDSGKKPDAATAKPTAAKPAPNP